MTPPSPVLILTNQLHTGGAETYVVQVSKWLTDRGADVVVAARPGELVDRLDPRVTYHPIDLKDVRLGLPVKAARIAALIARHRPRIVVANSLATAWVARLAALPFGVPVVSVAHGWPADRYRQVGTPLMVADRVIAVSDDVARRLIEGGLPPKNISVVPNGIDPAPFGPRDRKALVAARAAFGATDDHVVVASVGRYTEQKAQHRIIEVAKRLKDDLPELRFGIVGWGPLEQALRDRIQDAGVGDMVKILGRRDDVPDLLMGADLYLSTSDWEGMPLSMIEALAAGLPVVTTEVEGIRALVNPDNGILAAPDDVDALTEAVRRLGEDEVLRLQFGSHSRERFEGAFTLDAMGETLVAVLNEVLGEGWRYAS